MVNSGDAIPNVDLIKNSPGNKVNISKELNGANGLIIGVPAAFSVSSTMQSATIRDLMRYQVHLAPNPIFQVTSTIPRSKRWARSL